MVEPSLFCVCLFWVILGGVLSQTYDEPEQIHLSYGADETQMIVTWVTIDSTNNVSSAEYGAETFTMSENGTHSIFVDGGSERRQIHIHRVRLTDLIPGQRYIYHVGSPVAWSDVFYFTAKKSGWDWPARFAVYGDLGNSNPQSLARLQEETQKGHFDAILHVGDFAYNMDSENARVGDEFMRQIEAVAAYVPYMTCVGNHEHAYNFSNYINRFTMDGGDGQNFYFSFNVGPVHVISLSTEFYFFQEYGLMQIINQFYWLENDLKEANKPENRAKRPWIVTMGHRPMYCSNNDRDDCTENESVVRKGIPELKAFGLEDLFYKYGVDLELWAHEHSYERLWPVYNKKVCNGSISEPYTNPGAPVHLVTGSAGCQEHHDHFGPPRSWTAVQSDDFGYTRMTVFNSTHLSLEQVSDDKKGQVIDQIMIIKNKHGGGSYSCHCGLNPEMCHTI